MKAAGEGASIHGMIGKRLLAAYAWRCKRSGRPAPNHDAKPRGVAFVMGDARPPWRKWSGWPQIKPGCRG